MGRGQAVFLWEPGRGRFARRVALSGLRAEEDSAELGVELAGAGSAAWGTVWAGGHSNPTETPQLDLCGFRSGLARRRQSL